MQIDRGVVNALVCIREGCRKRFSCRRRISLQLVALLSTAEQVVADKLLVRPLAVRTLARTLRVDMEERREESSNDMMIGKMSRTQQQVTICSYSVFFFDSSAEKLGLLTARRGIFSGTKVLRVTHSNSF